MYKYRFIWPLFACLCIFFLSGRTAEAGLFDRIKDIYNAPEKVDELRKQYDDTKQSLEQQEQRMKQSLEQQEQMLKDAQTEMEKYAAEQKLLMEENERFRQQRDELQAQNAQLVQRLEQLEEDKANKSSLYRKWMSMIITAIALVFGYILSIRIWRYVVWRSQKQSGRGSIR